MTEAKSAPPSTASETKAIDYRPWLKTVRATRALTIADVLALPTGREFKFVCFCLNSDEFTERNHQQGRAYTPSELFSHNYVCEFTRSGGGISGTGWRTFKGDRSPLSEKSEPYTWHIEYTPGHWYPLSADGVLRNLDDDKDIPPELDGRHWSVWPQTTRLGWRGFMVPMTEIVGFDAAGVRLFWSNQPETAADTAAMPTTTTAVAAATIMTRSLLPATAAAVVVTQSDATGSNTVSTPTSPEKSASKE